MRRSYIIFLTLLLLLCVATIVLSIVSLSYNIINKNLLIAYIVIDSILVIYIIYLFCCKNKNGLIVMGTQYVSFFFNIANIFVIVYAILFYVDEILPKNKVVIFILYEIFFVMKMYIQISSMVRNANHLGYNDDNDEVYINRSDLDKLIEENMKLRKDRELLDNKKIYTISKIKDINKAKYKNIKIDIICNYIKSKYETNITKDSLVNKLLSKIKRECGFIFDKNNYEEIIIDYIKERISFYFKCPLTHQIFRIHIFLQMDKLLIRLQYLK